MNGFTRRVVLTQRQKVTRKWHIPLLEDNDDQNLTEAGTNLLTDKISSGFQLGKRK